MISLLNKLINIAIDEGLTNKRDEIYVKNQLIHLLNIDSLSIDEVNENISLPAFTSIEKIAILLDQISQYAVEDNVISNDVDEIEQLKTNMMNCIIPSPSKVNEIFHKKYLHSPHSTTDYFYKFSQLNQAIHLDSVHKNRKFKIMTKYGNLHLTINTSKPEKTPQQIKKESTVKLDYPKCLLCIENEGYVGRVGYPKRANHRIINIRLLDENWYFQFSPYSYYDEHSIVISEHHQPMVINKQTFERLIAFVNMFPHYFIGSNADLPIVGGSILSHDHYQAGQYVFPIDSAKETHQFTVDQFGEVSCSILQWPLSVIKLRSENNEQMTKLANYILQKWIDYEDDTNEIIPFTNKIRHNTITPIARKSGKFFELLLVLRNNRTTKEHPYGLFHPNKSIHHIKRENIGLIEVMGLAILPGRLDKELLEVEKFLLGNDHHIATVHQPWADEIKNTYKDRITKSTVNEIIQKEVGKKFIHGLEDAGVFKQSEVGQLGFKQFIGTL